MTAMKKRVLFLCIHNSARSQIAEAFLKQIAGDRFEVESAGLEPGKLNPLAVKAMREAGIDISRNTTQSVFDLFKSGKRYQYVISVCDDASAERCPIFPGVTTRLSWGFADPSAFTGTEQERLEETIRVRDEIRERIRRWVEEEEASQPLFGALSEGHTGCPNIRRNKLSQHPSGDVPRSAPSRQLTSSKRTPWVRSEDRVAGGGRDAHPLDVRRWIAVRGTAPQELQDSRRVAGPSAQGPLDEEGTVLASIDPAGTEPDSEGER